MLADVEAKLKQRDIELAAMSAQAIRYNVMISDLEAQLKTAKEGQTGVSQDENDQQSTQLGAKKKKSKPKRIPKIHSTSKDDLITEPVFQSGSFPGRPNFLAQSIKSIHDNIGSHSVESDRTFVYDVMRHVFDRKELQTQSHSGSLVTDEKTGQKYRKNILDSRRLEYVYQQYKIRSNAIGENPESRAVRSADGFFKIYVSNLTKSEHTRAAQEKVAQTKSRNRMQIITDDEDTE